MKKSFSRFGAVVAGIALVSFLAACGGGGGGGSPAPVVNPPAPQVDTTPPTLTLATSSPAALTTTIVIASNEDLGGNFQITVKDGATVIAGATTLNAGNRGITWTPAAALPCNKALAVTGSAVDLASNTGQFSGTVTTVACPNTALRYTNKTVVVWTEGYPFVVGLNGTSYALTRLQNLTGKTLGTCGAAQKPLPDGHVLFECTTIGGTQFERLAYSADVVAGTLSAFTGAVPSDITFTVVETNSVQPVAGTTSAHVAGGWYYADPNARWRLLFQNDAGGLPIVVKDGTFAADGTIGVIRAYSN